MTAPDIDMLYRVCEATWPPRRSWQMDGITLRDGGGGGKRVSAATTDRCPDPATLDAAAHEMRAIGQTPLFMIREGDRALDTLLEAAGYTVIDPVRAYRLPVAQLTDQPIPRVTAFTIWEPLAIMREIWAQGGIGPARVDVMSRAARKTGILARWKDKPAGAAFVGLHDGVAMVHAVEVLPHQRRQGVAEWIMRQAAFWAADNGADWISVLCTDANESANRLYQRLGFEAVGAYHYRIKEET